MHAMTHQFGSIVTKLVPAMSRNHKVHVEVPVVLLIIEQPLGSSIDGENAQTTGVSPTNGCPKGFNI